MTAQHPKLLLGTHKGLLMMERSGREWAVTQTAFPGIGVSYAFRDPRTGTLWAALDTDHWGSKLRRSEDGGVTWEEVIMPTYPEGETVPGDPFSASTEPKPARLSYIWLIAPGGADQPQRLYLGTEPGGLFASDDGGKTFDLVRGLWDHPSRQTDWFGGGRPYPGVHSMIIDPADSHHQWVAISVAGVFETTDDGQTWVPRNRGLIAEYLPNPYPEVGHDPHLLAASPANLQVMMQQNHVGIFRSEDAGRNWDCVSQEGGPARFGFPILMDEQDPDTAWVFPAVSDEQRIAVDGALCVSRTQDGGRTWQALRRGLPQHNCYDYPLRHAADLHGSHLAFGTTSGNLFFSPDKGETWECLGTNFPLFYSVRFDKA
jgi:photosystem II stability/assembly factor-like uncharacterized protein